MILVAGGAGYIGSHTNKYLHGKGHKTVVYDSLIRGHREFVKWGEFVQGDLADKEQLRRCFRKYPISAVMYFCAFAYVGESVADPAKYYRNNVANTLNLLDVMREFSVSRFIFSSSCSIYGLPKKLPLTEDHPQAPINPYGKSKVMVEEILRDYDSAYGIKHINLRYFNAAGADPDCEIGELHDPETHLIPLAIAAATGKRKNIEIFGTDYATKDGTCIRDYIHVTDLADAHARALDHLARTGASDSFNLGTGAGYSVRDVINVVKKISQGSPDVIEAEKRPGDPPTLISSSAKAKSVLGWSPAYSDIDTIIRTAFSWHSRQDRSCV